MVTIPPTNQLPEDIFEKDETPATPTKKPKAEKQESSKVPLTPSVEQIDDVLAAKVVKNAEDKQDLITNETIQEVKQEIAKEEVKQEIAKEEVTKVAKEDSNVVVPPPTTNEITERKQRIENTKKGSSFVKILFVLLIISIVLIIAGLSYYFFTSTVEETVEEVVTEDVVEPEIPEEIIDVSTWEEYSNDVAGITFGYPEDFTIKKYDDELGPPNTSSTPQVILTSPTGEEVIKIWIDTSGIAQFIGPQSEVYGNPLNAGIHFILEREGDDVEKYRTRYLNERSGVISPDLSTILAYIPEHPGVWQYVFLYKRNAGIASEDFMEAFVRTIDLAFDTDNDGLFDDEEVGYGTDPNIADTDGDGYSDYEEISNHYNPLGEGFLEY